MLISIQGAGAILGGPTAAPRRACRPAPLLGGAAGWRTTFAAIGAIAALVAMLLAAQRPALPGTRSAGLRQRITTARLPGVNASLLVTGLWITAISL